MSKVELARKIADFLDSINALKVYGAHVVKEALQENVEVASLWAEVKDQVSRETEAVD